jgi:peptide/nickel transport system permease protein
VVGGLVVVEDVFTLPGVGRLLLDAIFQRDYPVVQGVILLLAATFMALNLAVDVLYAVLDPRLRRG